MTTVRQNKDPRELLILLKQEQVRLGCLTDEALVQMAQTLDVPLNEVYGVATFYSFISPRPLGKYAIRVCKSVPCYMKHGEMLVKRLEEELGIRPGETTQDGKFSLLLTNCIGACDQAPGMMINDNVHTDLTPGKISEILEIYK